MSDVARNPNIFRVLEAMKSAWESISNFDTSGFSEEELEAWRIAQRRFVFEGADIRQTYVTELEDYLFSCEWTDRAVVREIVGYIQMGKPLYNIGALKKALLRLRLASEPVEVNTELSLRQLGWIEAHIAQADSFHVGRENLDKYLQSVLFLALTSRTFTLNLLDDIDPTALGYAFKDMQADSVNSTKLLFSLLLRRLTSASVACKEELAIVKKEYQDFMRGS